MSLPTGISIGIDIGVSTSGVSYCFVDCFGKAEGPPVSVPLLAAKAHLQPTVLAKQGNRWGTDVRPDDDKFTLLKLALLDDELEGEPQHVRAVQQELYKIAAAGSDGLTVLSDYMRMMWADARIKIEKAVAERLRGQKASLKSSLVFSIPAVWSERSTERMQQVIDKSGIATGATFEGLVLEPEAASLAILPTLRLNKGDTVVIADLGGGTVDFISYTLSSTTARRFDQCVAAEGRLLGDMFMKSALRSFIVEKVKRELNIEIESLHQTLFEAQVEKVWINACNLKQGAKDLCGWSCDVLTKREDGVQMQPVVIDGPSVTKTFQSITDGIVALIRSQMEAADEKEGWPPQAIVVVGGFGRNKFLQGELRIHFGDLVRFTEKDGPLAVKKGAAMYGVAKVASENATNQQSDPVEGFARIDSRMARKSYGAWPGTGPKELLFWFISKNQTVDDHHAPIILPLAAFQARTDRNQPCVPIYSCGRQVKGLRSIGNDITSYQHPYQIRCTHPDYLGGVESLQVRPRLNDRLEVEFDVQEDMRWMFEVEKLK